MRHSRAGFGLMDLLIGLFSLIMLLSLLLPATQRAREHSRQSHCQFHLREIGQALQLHLDTYSVLPTGGGDRLERIEVNGEPADYRKQQWGWAYQILPHLGERQLWSSRDYEARGHAVDAFFCPVRRGPTLFDYNALMDYAAIGGGGDNTNAQEGLNYLADPPQEHNGVFVPLVRDLPATRQPFIGRGDIIDGLSSTMAVSEKAVSRRCLSGGSPGDNRGYWANWCWDSVRFVRDPTFDFGSGEQPPRDSHLAPSRDADLPCDRHYDFLGSAHASGFESLNCDGAVQLLNYEIDTEILKSLANRRDQKASR